MSKKQNTACEDSILPKKLEGSRQPRKTFKLSLRARLCRNHHTVIASASEAIQELSKSNIFWIATSLKRFALETQGKGVDSTGSMVDKTHKTPC